MVVRRGVAHVPFPFTMEIKTRSGNAFTGIVTWPTLEKAQTKVKGTLANDQLKVNLSHNWPKRKDGLTPPPQTQSLRSSR
jgi:hypothetical protein